LSSFNRSHFSIFIHEYVIFLPHSPSYTPPFPYILPLPGGPQLSVSSLETLHNSAK
jgi:hypothetical protein